MALVVVREQQQQLRCQPIEHPQQLRLLHAQQQRRDAVALVSLLRAPLERTMQPDATQWRWLWCEPIRYRQHGLAGRQLTQLQA